MTKAEMINGIREMLYKLVITRGQDSVTIALSKHGVGLYRTHAHDLPGFRATSCLPEIIVFKSRVAYVGQVVQLKSVAFKL